MSLCVFQDRLAMESKSHTTEIMQKTRIELENGDISTEEIDESIRVRSLLDFRFRSVLDVARLLLTLFLFHSLHLLAGLSIPSQAVRMYARRPR